MTDDEIIKEEIERLLNDIRTAYEQSGRKASGEFAKGLHAVYEPQKATIVGYTYLAGRGPTKKKGKPGEPTLKEAIEKWIKVKGITAIEDNISTSQLAYLIARKIHQKGTDRSKWYKIYESVITPQRIDEIFQRVAQINANRIITEIRANLEILAKEV